MATQTQALEAGGGEQDGVVLAFLKLAQASVDVAAQGVDIQVRIDRAQLRLAAQTGSADAGAGRKIAQTRVLARNESVPRVLPLRDGDQLETGGQVHGHILDRVHGEVGAAFRHGRFQLLHEQTLATDARERRIENLVALGGHAEQLDLQTRVQFQEAGLDVFGLPQGKLALARGDDDFFRHD